MDLYLIRHGETEWSLLGRHTGRSDLPLTPAGEDQARALESGLAGLHFSHVLCSPLQRARSTCSLAGLGRRIVVDADLAEWDYGDYEGRGSPQIQLAHPQWNLFRDGCPNGESPQQVSDRADRFITRVQRLDGRIAIFSHGQYLCVLAARWIGLPLVEAEHLRLHTASLSILGFDPHHPEVPVIERWNGNVHNVDGPARLPTAPTPEPSGV